METTFDFERDVVAKSQAAPVVVDFWAPWCAPCRVLGPVLERLAEQAAGRWTLVKVDTEQHPALAATYQIASIPAVKMFYRGKVVAEFAGALPEPQIARWLFKNIPSPGSDVLSEAQQARREARLDAAKALFASALQQDPALKEAQIGLAELTLADDPAAAVALLDDIHEGDEHYTRAEALRELRRVWDLDANAVDQGSAAWPQYAAGRQALRAGQYDEAAECFIAALRRDRKWQEDAARRACVSLFRWLGDDHPVTQGHRRAFSSALF